MKVASRYGWLLLCACSFAAHAEKMYRWVDAQGKVHFSDRPQGNARVIDVRPGSGPGAADSKSALASRIDAAECRRRQDQLAGYRQSERIVEKNALGVEREYTPEERNRLLRLTEQAVAESCGAAAP